MSSDLGDPECLHLIVPCQVLPKSHCSAYVGSKAAEFVVVSAMLPAEAVVFLDRGEALSFVDSSNSGCRLQQ